MKAGLRRIFINVKACIKKEDGYQIKNLTYHLKTLEKEQTKPKASRRKEIIQIRAGTHETEKRKTKKIN